MDVMLRFSDQALCRRMPSRKTFYDFMDSAQTAMKPNYLMEWISGWRPATASNLPEFESCRKTLVNLATLHPKCIRHSPV